MCSYDFLCDGYDPNITWIHPVATSNMTPFATPSTRPIMTPSTRLSQASITTSVVGSIKSSKTPRLGRWQRYAIVVKTWLHEGDKRRWDYHNYRVSWM